MTSLSKKTQKSSQAIDEKIQQLKNKQYTLETKMVQQLHRALKTHQGFSLPFPTLMGGLIDVMEQVKANSNQAEAWNVSGGKFLRQRIKQQSQIPPSKNCPAVSTLSTAMENPYDQA
jgi:hypothetical protein